MQFCTRLAMEVSETGDWERAGILDLPEEVLEYILSLISPYGDLECCRLVCRKWKDHANAVAKRLVQRFYKSIAKMDVTWNMQCPDPGPSIIARYSHCACRYNNSMFVFGGCTLMETAFNDLWRFDLSTRRWVRPLAVGTYPPPSASSTLVVHKDTLIVFGGWASSSPSLLYQGRRCFNSLHLYSPESNRWDRITTPTCPPPMAKHSATVHDALMVVFGGVQLASSDRESFRQCYRFSDVWVFDIVNCAWWMQETSEPKPEPRFNHSQIRIDDDHALVIGGCGGPNRMLRDVWLLTVDRRIPSVPWIWAKIAVHGAQFSPPNMWGHHACKVGDSVVFLSSGKRSELSAKHGLCSLSRVVPRVWRPPQANNVAHFSPEECVNGRKGTFAKRVKVQNVKPHSSEDEEEDAVKPVPRAEEAPTKNVQVPSDKIFVGEVASTSQSGPSPSLPTRNSPMPSMKANLMRNWERHLVGLQRMEDKLRSLRPSPVASKSSKCPKAKAKLDSSRCNSSSSRCLKLYALDVSRVVQDKTATWLPVKPNDFCGGYPETVYCSLVEGRGELILFGGVQNRESKCKVFDDEDSDGVAVISNTLAFVCPKKFIV